MSWKSLRYNVKRSLAIVLLLAFVVLVGCATYHRVADPASENVYYTKKIKQQKRGGTVTFTDDRTGARVTLQNSEIQKISREEYKEAVKKD